MSNLKRECVRWFGTVECLAISATTVILQLQIVKQS